MEAILDIELQPLSYIDFQIPDESLESETEYELMHYNSIPLTFNSFKFLKKKFNHVMEDKHTKYQEFVLEPIKQSSQSMQDSIVDVLDDLCCQILFSFSSYDIKRIYDQDMIRKSVAWSISTRVSFQSLAEKL